MTTSSGLRRVGSMQAAMSAQTALTALQIAAAATWQARTDVFKICESRLAVAGSCVRRALRERLVRLSHKHKEVEQGHQLRVT